MERSAGNLAGISPNTSATARPTAMDDHVATASNWTNKRRLGSWSVQSWYTEPPANIYYFTLRSSVPLLFRSCEMIRLAVRYKQPQARRAHFRYSHDERQSVPYDWRQR